MLYIYIHTSLNDDIEFISSRETSAATTPEIANINRKYIFITRQ